MCECEATSGFCQYNSMIWREVWVNSLFSDMIFKMCMTVNFKIHKCCHIYKHKCKAISKWIETNLEKGPILCSHVPNSGSSGSKFNNICFKIVKRRILPFYIPQSMLQLGHIQAHWYGPQSVDHINPVCNNHKKKLNFIPQKSLSIQGKNMQLGQMTAMSISYGYYEYCSLS